MNKIDLKTNQTMVYWILLSVAVVIGIVVRLTGLATWPLALDEYYIIKSSENVLKYGLPQFPNGGYYERGLLMQYLIAPLLALGVKAEFAGRIFPLLSNLAAIPAVYLIAKKAGNQVIAFMAVVIFSLSIWEIEFARYARMYAPFQTVFIWYVFFALKDFENKSLNNFKWLLLFSVVAIFLYEGSIFLALFNFVPFVILKRFNLKHFITSAAVFVFSVFYNIYSFKTINARAPFPQEYLDFKKHLASTLPVKIPKILLPFSLQNDYFIFTSSIVIAITIIILFLMIKKDSAKNILKIISIAVLGLCAVLNQFGLFVLLFLLFFLWKFIDREFLTKKNMFLLGTVFIINFVHWYGYGILLKEWYVLFTDFSSYSLWGITKRLLMGFFDYPETYTSVLNYFRVLPLLTVFSAIMLAILFISIFMKKMNNEKISFLLGAIIFMGLAANLPDVLYDETRYTFFAVPILMIVLLFTIHHLFDNLFSKQQLVISFFSLITISIFVLSKDFSINHIINIDEKVINYRMDYDKFYKKHIYRRWDIKNPTDYVKQNLKENDLIMINENSQEYYLPRVDYFNFDYKHRAFVALSVEGGKRERWSNAKLIYKHEDLINFIDNRKTTIWYLVYPENWLIEINFYERYKSYFVSQGVDRVIKVFRFPAERN
jgi:hypothetical protein